MTLRPAILLALVYLTGFAQAQAPRAGREHYEESLNYGFRFRAPKGWDYVPPDPRSPNLLGLYTPSGEDRSVSAGEGKFLYPRLLLLAFDRRPREEVGATEQERTRNYLREQKRTSRFEEWIQRRSAAHIGEGFALETTDPLTVDGVAGAKSLLYRGTSHALIDGSGQAPSYAFAGLYPLSEQVDIALCFTAPAQPSKWSKWQRNLVRMLRSFERVPLFQPSSLDPNLSPKERRRAELQARLRSQPGWRLYEDSHGFLLAKMDDEAFLAELQKRFGLLQGLYSARFPEALVEKARELRWKDRDPEAAPTRVSEAAVIRLFSGEGEYRAYGAPPGSAGYWLEHEQEVVLYDDRASSGRSQTWRVLAHEAFHQFLSAYTENLRAHPWFDEGHAEYFAGFELRRDLLAPGPHPQRLREIESQVREERYAPLERLVRWSRQEFYGSNSAGRTLAENYAQAWSLVWFLRDGPRDPRSWNPNWSGILDTYVATLVATANATKALEAAFDGIALAELESAWVASVAGG